jgi:hypothetical protein
MATTNLIVIRLHPTAPVSGDTFTNYLKDLQITAYDLSFSSPRVGVQVGPTAKYIPPTLHPPVLPPQPPPPLPPVIPPAIEPTFDPATTIVQHFVNGTVMIGVLVCPCYVTAAVATAVIAVPAPPAGQTTYENLRFEVKRGNGQITVDNVYYNVPTGSGSPGPDQFQPSPPWGGGGTPTTSLFLALPAPPADPNAVSVVVPADGTAPRFDDLLNAVNKVLGADPGAPAPDLATQILTPDQCRNIAYEIVWGKQDPLPVPGPETMEDLYTNPPNTGDLKDKPNERDRQQFEGTLSSYYSTRAAAAERLTNYVAAVAAGIWCANQTKTAQRAVLDFPVEGKAGAAVSAAEVVLVMPGGAALSPAFAVPADFFYVLGATMAATVPPQRRLQQACLEDPGRVANELQRAIDAGILTKDPGKNTVKGIGPEQGARRLAALGTPGKEVPVCPISGPDLPVLVQAWLDYNDSIDIGDFWQKRVLVTGAAPHLAAGYLDLVLCALTVGYDKLSQKIVAPKASGGLGVTSVQDVDAVAAAQWEALFQTDPTLLPPFTKFGNLDARIAAFVSHVQQFFTADASPNKFTGASLGQPVGFGLPDLDRIGQAAALLGANYVFGSGATPAQIQGAATSVFPADPQAQKWLRQTLQAIEDLCALAKFPGSYDPTKPQPNFPFAVVEALYARGFTKKQDVEALSADDFQTALTGTVAYEQAAAMHSAAQTTEPPPDNFQPANPDGTLTDCVPPPHLSPFGPAAYLQKMLSLSEAATCQDPNAPPTEGRTSLGDAIAKRRGPLGKTLLVTASNLEVPLPFIDIVNECLENLAANGPPGAVYNTATDDLAKHKLCTPCQEHPGENGHHDACHRPERLFATLPEHSTPATPVGQPGGYAKLRTDFSSPRLPYSQPLDVNRSYLRQLRTCRADVMRTFRKDITEFVLDPTLSDSVFQAYLWRYPVRAEIAAETLGINPEEYTLLFTKDIAPRPTSGQVSLPELYGFDTTSREINWIAVVSVVSEFLTRTGLTYCEFIELQKSGFVVFRDLAIEGGAFPDCPSCYLDKETIDFGNREQVPTVLKRLAVFIRLWRKLRENCRGGYSFAQLRDVCEVLHLFQNGSVNSDFVRQFAAFQMLRDDFGLPLTGKINGQGGTTPADRIPLLALWQPGAGSQSWDWAIHHLLERVQHRARAHHGCAERPPEFIKLLAENLRPLSRLAGFDPDSPADTWHALPTHSLRFAEVLAKIYASDFGVGEILYLFTADEHLDGDDPFPLQDKEEGNDLPLGLPEEGQEHSLWALRRRLLAVELSGHDACTWSWTRIEEVLREEFGYDPPTGGSDPLRSLGEHFFPHVLESCGCPVDVKGRQYRVNLPGSQPQMWNTPADGPFRYDASAEPGQLWTQLPLRDEAVIAKLSHIRALNPQEARAVQDLYYKPRADLAPFAFFFPDFTAAERYLIEEPEESKRWAFFQSHFAQAFVRSRVVAHHLAVHVASVAGRECGEEGKAIAWRVLQHMLADESKVKGPWEDDSGAVPEPASQPLPGGGAFAALLGLTGTGLLGEICPEGAGPAWREVRGPMNAFGHEKNVANCPVPTILPATGLKLTKEQERFVTARNGFALKDRDGAFLGGAQGFSVRWSGVLLVENEGTYEFRAGAPTPHSEAPDVEAAEHHRWRVALRRGQRVWIVLNHHWSDEAGRGVGSVPLKRGAYHIVVEFAEPAPFTRPEGICPQHTGFEVKYAGPDSGGQLQTIPLDRLYRDHKDQTLGGGLEPLERHPAGQFLDAHFTSTLRDIRRTYQRAFKAVLFTHRFSLRAQPAEDQRESELGYLFAHKHQFAGVSYFRNSNTTGDKFSKHAADFDFNLLPLFDEYQSPATAQDQRVKPSAKRTQALFDWWERMFDYTRMRHAAHRAREHPVWLLFLEASEKQPDNPPQLVRHLGVDLRHAELVLHYFQDPAQPLYAVSSDDLEDDRWAVRVWHAEKWVRALWHAFAPKNIREARPALWAADDPGVAPPPDPADPSPPPPEDGNANLTRFVDDGYFENGATRRYEDVRRLNDRLRERGRIALLAYLCGMNRVPLPWPPGSASSPRDLSDLLLLDIEAGVCERASRIEEAVTAVQNFIRRCRLGLEPGWEISHAFALLWDRHFASYRTWEACERREKYRENWVEWEELEKARKSEGFRFLESELRQATLTVAVPGGLDYWPDQRPLAHPGEKVLQAREPATMQALDPDNHEGFGLLGRPERDARPSWLAAIMGKKLGNGNGRRGDRTPQAEVVTPGGSKTLPFWIESAMRLGTRFYRIAAAGAPPASTQYQPHEENGEAHCCAECGRVHPAHVDEYYFWLVDSQKYAEAVPPGTPDPAPENKRYGYQDDYYDPTKQESAEWHDPEQLPALLNWESKPTVRLAWCRVHHGEFCQPRTSAQSVRVSDPSAALDFIGRLGDSLTFAVQGGVVPVGYKGTSPPPDGNGTPRAGFRFDLAIDVAVALPLVVDPPVVKTSYPGGLPAYPYFAFFAPGASVFPRSLYGPSLAVARALRAHCRFEAALKWYRLVFDPLRQDCTWVHCPKDRPTNPGRTVLGEQPPPTPGRPPAENETGPGEVVVRNGQEEACCQSTKVLYQVALNRSVLLHFVETLFELGDAHLRRRSPEGFQQARLVFDTVRRVLGKRPRRVVDEAPVPVQTVNDFVPEFAPLNPRLLDSYERVEDRLELIHACIDARRLRNGRSNRDMPYWGDSPLREGWRTEERICPDEEEWCHPHSPYRFPFLIQKALETAGQVRELGNALLNAFQQGDAEYLASMRGEHERQLFDLTLAVRQDQWREADWQVQALAKTKESAQANLRYFSNLLQNGLISDETQYVDLTGVSLASRTAGTVSEAVAQAMNIVPDITIGAAGFGGSPVEVNKLPLGSKLAAVFSTVARIMNTLADIASTTASLDLTQGSWQRRADDWIHQTQVLPIEIQQIELQILAAERRRDQALHELNNQRRQLEQSADVQDFLRDKFTNYELFLWQQKEIASLYYRMYELALHVARQAERAFNFERGHTARRFLPDEAWDDLHEGLLAGERLQLALRRMDAAYLDQNRREYELAKHFSLRLHFPVEFLRLKATGRCEIELPEWMFDLDHPGNFMRRIKNVTLTVPCVAGPYNGVNSRLTLLSSVTRVDPRLIEPPAACCRDGRPSDDGYEAGPSDPRIVKQYGATEAIATSSGQNDSGLFELNFRDERYLPFEYLGAVSRWRIELPPENNFFDMDTLSDLILNLNYTAREGGDVLRRAANDAAQRHLPGDGLRFFDLRHEFPDMWQFFNGRRGERECPSELGLRLGRGMFPFLPAHRDVTITRIDLFFEAQCAEAGAHRVVEFLVGHRIGHAKEGRCECEVRRVNYIASAEWPGLYHGVLDVRFGPLSRHGEDLGTFRFPHDTGAVSHAYLLCRWVSDRSPLPAEEPKRKSQSGKYPTG